MVSRSASGYALIRPCCGHPLYLRTVLSEGFDYNPRAPPRLALPRSLAAAIGAHLGVLPPETRSIVEMLSVLNLRMPLAQLGQAADVDSPGVAIEPAVACGLVDWSLEEPSCPVVIRHPLVRDAIYASITAAGRYVLHARAASVVSEAASWEHRVAALDRPDEALAAQLEHLAGKDAADGRLALAATHLQWASDISPARTDRERRLLIAALHLMEAEESRDPALRQAVEESPPPAPDPAVPAGVVALPPAPPEPGEMPPEALCPLPALTPTEPPAPPSAKNSPQSPAPPPPPAIMSADTPERLS